jgi:NAD(P)-dependent dehydrogenase (short-subunit alcohol dehydrogenase family)
MAPPPLYSPPSGGVGEDSDIVVRRPHEGANVAICARNADDVSKIVKALAAKGVKSWGRALDVADPPALKQWVEGAATELGGIDTIVCNVSALVSASPELRVKG